jgi:hypothetical protein
LLTSAVIVGGRIPKSTVEVETFCRLTLAAAAIGTAGIALLLIPGFTSGSLSEFLTGLPKIGQVLGQLISAVRIYRKRWPTVCVALMMSVCSHGLFTLSLYLIARGMFEHVPTLREHMILVPLGMVAGSLPLAPAGFGAFEFAIGELYKIIPAAPDIDVAGILVALVYRLLTIMVAMIGVVIYWFSRSEVRQLKNGF